MTKSFSYMLVALLAVYCLSMPDGAQARPGTPNNVIAFECDDFIQGRPTGRYYSDTPKLCVTFNNTATEPVVFEDQVTVDGAPVQNPGSTCLMGTMQRYSCEASSNIRGEFTGGAKYVKDWPDWNHEGLTLEGLDYQRNYCIRFRTREADIQYGNLPHAALSDREVSLLWSNWACHTTSAKPPAPVKPQVTVTLSPHGDKVGVSWTRDKYVDYYTVQDHTSRPHSDMALLPKDVQDKMVYTGRITDNGFTLDVSWGDAIDMQGEAYFYAVCAYNVIGQRCSDWASSLPPGVIPRSYANANIAARGEKDVPPKPDFNITANNSRSSLVPPPPPILTAQSAMIPTPQMAGTFDTSFGVLTLGPPSGTYTTSDGRVSVTNVHDNVMEGTWEQSKSSQRCADGRYYGKFTFIFAAQGFTGSFGYCNGPLSAGAWNGTRRSTALLKHALHP